MRSGDRFSASDHSRGPASAGSLTLVLGGVRSGKSRFAQSLSEQLGADDVWFVATAERRDDEMRQRIEHHRRTRPSCWHTLEITKNVGAGIAQEIDRHTATGNPMPQVLLVDCLTLLISNRMCGSGDGEERPRDLQDQIIAEIDALAALARLTGCHVVIVSGEVGLGIVPEHAMGRLFRDLLGLANQHLAESATASYLMVAGMAINTTQLATSVSAAANRCRVAMIEGNVR